MCCRVCIDAHKTSHPVMSKTHLKSTYFEVHLFEGLNEQAFTIVCVLNNHKQVAFWRQSVRVLRWRESNPNTAGIVSDLRAGRTGIRFPVFVRNVSYLQNSRLALWPVHPPILDLLEFLLPELQQPVCEVSHSRPSNAAWRMNGAILPLCSFMARREKIVRLCIFRFARYVELH